MRNVYHFVYRLSACLEKHGQFQKLGNIYNKEMVPERRNRTTDLLITNQSLYQL